MAVQAPPVRCNGRSHATAPARLVDFRELVSLVLGYIQLLLSPAELFDCHNLGAKMSIFS